MASVDGSMSLWSPKGICLHSVVVPKEHIKATACCFHPSSQQFAFTSIDGEVGVASLKPSVVHGLHRETYARRTALDEVTIRNLITDKTTTIK